MNFPTAFNLQNEQMVVAHHQPMQDITRKRFIHDAIPDPTPMRESKRCKMSAVDCSSDCCPTSNTIVQGWTRTEQQQQQQQQQDEPCCWSEEEHELHRSMVQFPTEFNLEEMLLHQPILEDVRRKRSRDTIIPAPTPLLYEEFKRIFKLPSYFPTTTKNNATFLECDGSKKEQEEVVEPFWSEQAMHRAMMATIFEIGVKRASPVKVAEFMQRPPPELTSERIKSRLQKFRMARVREQEKFLRDYDEFLLCAADHSSADPAPSPRKSPSARGASSCDTVTTMGAGHQDDDDDTTPLPSPRPQPDRSVGGMTSDSKRKTGGQVAASITQSVMNNEEQEHHHQLLSAQDINNFASLITTSNPQQQHHHHHQSAFAAADTPPDMAFPSLTEKERKSPLGMSLLMIKGLMEKYMDKENFAEQQMMLLNSTTTTTTSNSGNAIAAHYCSSATTKTTSMMMQSPAFAESTTTCNTPSHHHLPSLTENEMKSPLDMSLLQAKRLVEQCTMMVPDTNSSLAVTGDQRSTIGMTTDKMPPPPPSTIQNDFTANDVSALLITTSSSYQQQQQHEELRVRTVTPPQEHPPHHHHHHRHDDGPAPHLHHQEQAAAGSIDDQSKLPIGRTNHNLVVLQQEQQQQDIADDLLWMALKLPNMETMPHRYVVPPSRTLGGPLWSQPSTTI